MANLPVNSKSFSITNTASKAFDVVLSGFQFATSLFFRVISTISITSVMSTVSSATSLIRLYKVRLTSSIKLITSQVQTITIKRVRFAIIMKSILSNVLAVYVRKPIVFVSSARIKAITALSTGINVLDISPTLAVFSILSDYDPQTIGSLDASTLGDMDYTV